MQLIPVIDLLNGIAVHAQQGKRDTYQAIASPLCSSAEPEAVIAAMLDYYPFTTLYVADLNSIQQKAIDGQHYARIKAICKQYPSVSFWVDAGANTPNTIDQWQAIGVKPILGTENCLQLETYQAAMQHDCPPEILSLDYLNDHFLGDADILAIPNSWPETVIAMTLANVGTNAGPNWATLAHLKQHSPRTQLIAAGGVRNIADLQQLKQQGIEGALVATALHHKQLSATALNMLLSS